MHARPGFRVVSITSIFVLLPAPLLAQVGVPAALARDVDERVETARIAMKAPGLTVAIGARNRLVHSGGFGRADVENDVPATSKTVYRTASVSKPFTAAALLQLVEGGAIRLDASVRESVPALPATYDRVTLRDLLRHTGGVRHYRDDAEFVTTRRCDDLTRSLEIFAADPLDHGPGEKITYSSYGFTLVGLAIESAAGMPYDRYMRERVFEPAGMSATRRDDLDIVPHRAAGYAIEEDGTLRNSMLFDSSCRVPAGGHLSTAEDLVRFMHALTDGQLIGPQSLAEMTRSHLTPEIIQRTLAGLEVPEGFEPPGLGFGWAILPNGAFFHGGNQPGFTSLLYHDPATRVTIALMTNLEEQGDSLVGLAAELATLVSGSED